MPEVRQATKERLMATVVSVGTFLLFLAALTQDGMLLGYTDLLDMV